MKNWLGQEISVGDYVGCGRRNGNTTSYRLGRVVSFDETKGLVNVKWLHEPFGAPYREWRQKTWISVQTFTGRSSIGNPGIDTLFLLDINSFSPQLAETLKGE